MLSWDQIAVLCRFHSRLCSPFLPSPPLLGLLPFKCSVSYTVLNAVKFFGLSQFSYPGAHSQVQVCGPMLRCDIKLPLLAKEKHGVEPPLESCCCEKPRH